MNETFWYIKKFVKQNQYEVIIKKTFENNKLIEEKDIITIQHHVKLGTGMKIYHTDGIVSTKCELPGYTSHEDQNYKIKLNMKDYLLTEENYQFENYLQNVMKLDFNEFDKVFKKFIIKYKDDTYFKHQNYFERFLVYLDVCDSFKIDTKIKKSFEKHYIKKRLNLLNIYQQLTRQSLIYNRFIKSAYHVKELKPQFFENYTNDIKNRLEFEKDQQYAYKIYNYLLKHQLVCVNVNNKDIVKMLNGYNINEDWFLKMYYFKIYKDCIYNISDFELEQKLGIQLKKIINNNKKIDLTMTDIQNILKGQKQFDKLYPDQKEALTCLNHPISIITGTAGTGKSQVITGLKYILTQKNKTFKVIALAAKAIDNLSGGSSKSEDTDITLAKFITINKDNKDNLNVLIIEECSMFDYNNLSKCLNNIDQLILVGDINQLSPIGSGSILDQLSKSKLVKTYVLTESHRYKDNKDIYEKLINFNSSDDYSKYNIINADIEDHGISQIIEEYKKYNLLNEKNKDRIIILCPSEKICKKLGQFQKHFKPYNDNNNEYYIGMPLLCIENVIQNTEYKFINGKIYTVHKIETNRDIKLYNDRTGDINIMTEKDFDKFTPGFFTTFHKAQGTGWEYVILYLPDDNKYNHMYTKNLIYTGLSRATKDISIICNSSKFNEYIQPSKIYGNLYEMIDS